MAYLGLQDLEKRWVYTRQGVHKLTRRADFPKPCFTINGGKTKVWRETAIEAYEQQRPELRSAARKVFKMKGYALTRRKGRRR